MLARSMHRLFPKPMYIFLQAALLFSLSTYPESPLHAQNLNYNVVMNGKSIGSLEAKRNVRDGLAYYFIESIVNLRFLFRVNMNYTFETTYQDGMLIKASTRNMVNDNVRNSSRVTWNGAHYVLEVKDEQSVLKNTKITYSLSSMYFSEPVQVRQVFSERYGKFLPVKPVGEHRYELTMPDGKKNYYQYVNGICQSVEVNHSMGQVNFHLTNQK